MVSRGATANIGKQNNVCVKLHFELDWTSRCVHYQQVGYKLATAISAYGENIFY